MKKIALLLFSLAITVALPGNALAYNNLIKEVNDACGYEVVPDKDCSYCHDASGDYQLPTDQKDLYLSQGPCGFCSGVACDVTPPTVEDLYAYARDTVTLDYFEDIFGAFITHLNDAIADPVTGDPFADVFPDCPVLAAEIASDHSRLTGNLVRRVTTRTRNSRNIPDAWELEQLLNFEKMAADGDPRNLLEVTKPDGGTLNSKEFEAFAVVTEEVGRGKNKVEQHYFRYMRSLTMPPMPFAMGGPEYLDPPANTIANPNLPCLKCHGTAGQVSQGVKDATAEYYPYDTAMGYKPGEIRGAWTVKVPLTEVPE